MTIYDFKVQKADGAEVSLADYKGEVLLIVNTATGCGFTPQYKGLQELYDKYAAQGFEVLDFPCNQFGNQAPGTDAEIGQFCEMRYKTTFPRFAKVDVNGPQAEPLFTYLKRCKGSLLGSKIKWNFTKFLVARTGEVVARYGSATKPEKIENDIKKLLAQ